MGTVLALIINMEQYENFLYAIGSVFAPMFAILLTDYFLYKNNRVEDGPAVNWLAITVWAAGVAIYYQFIKLDFILGATVPVMIITIFLHIILKEAVKKWNYLKGYAEI